MQTFSRTATSSVLKISPRFYKAPRIPPTFFSRLLSQVASGNPKCNLSYHFKRFNDNGFLRRSYSADTTEPQQEQASNKSFPDPTRPDMFYHFLNPPTPASSTTPVYALSFLPFPPPSADSSSIIGWLLAGTESADQEAGLNDFKENPKFRQLLYEAVQSGLKADVDDIQRNAALQLQQGWMHIHDDRKIPPLGRIGDPDDILASVLVEDGKIVPDTYQAMPAYRLCTADGITQLTEGLSKHLNRILVEKVEMERRGK